MKAPVYPTSLGTGLVWLCLLLTLTACDNPGGNRNSNAPLILDATANTPSPTHTSSPTSTPSPTGTYPPTNTPYPEPLHPCGPTALYYAGRLQEHFLHWTHDGSRLVFDVDDTIWVMDLQQVRLWQVADVDHNYSPSSYPPRGSMSRLLYGFHADLSPEIPLLCIPPVSIGMAGRSIPGREPGEPANPKWPLKLTRSLWLTSTEERERD